MMLAMKIIAARGHEPDVQRYTTPLMIVSVCEPNKKPVSMTGRTFAGI